MMIISDKSVQSVSDCIEKEGFVGVNFWLMNSITNDSLDKEECKQKCLEVNAY